MFSLFSSMLLFVKYFLSSGEAEVHLDLDFCLQLSSPLWLQQGTFMVHDLVLFIGQCSGQR